MVHDILFQKVIVDKRLSTSYRDIDCVDYIDHFRVPDSGVITAYYLVPNVFFLENKPYMSTKVLQ